MTVSSTTARQSYTGNDSTATYNYGFKIFRDDDILLTVVSPAGVETTLVKTTDYTVSGVGVAAGGSIVLVDAGQAWISASSFLDTGYKLVLRRQLDLKQLTSLDNQGPFYAQVHEDQFDQFTMVDQQQQDEVDRSLKLSEAIDPADFDTTIPGTIVGKTNVTFMTNAAGDAIVEGPTAASISGAEAQAIAAAASAVAAAASETAAGLSETAAAASETAAGVSETNAAASETAAGLSETAAEAAQTAAELAETNAAASETAAGVSETNAAASETAAGVSETNAAASETAAGLSETAAAASETAAGVSETNAAASASAASASADEAAVSAAEAAASATGEAIQTISTTSSVTSGSTLVLLTADSITATLPALGTAGKRIKLLNQVSGISTITIDGNGAETINGATTTTLNTFGEFIEIVDNTTDWVIVNRVIPSGWVEYTPTVVALGTVTSPKVFYRRKGDSLSVRGMLVTGTPTAVNLSVSLPAGAAIDFDKLGTATGNKYIGRGNRNIAAVNNEYTLLATTGTTDKFFVGITDTNTVGREPFSPLLGTNLFTSTEVFTFEVQSVAITGWNG